MQFEISPPLFRKISAQQRSDEVIWVQTPRFTSYLCRRPSLLSSSEQTENGSVLCDFQMFATF